MGQVANLPRHSCRCIRAAADWQIGNLPQAHGGHPRGEPQHEHLPQHFRHRPPGEGEVHPSARRHAHRGQQAEEVVQTEEQHVQRQREEGQGQDFFRAGGGRPCQDRQQQRLDGGHDRHRRQKFSRRDGQGRQGERLDTRSHLGHAG